MMGCSYRNLTLLFRTTLVTTIGFLCELQFASAVEDIGLESFSSFFRDSDVSGADFVQFKFHKRPNLGNVGKLGMFANKDIKKGEIIYAINFYEHSVVISLEEAFRDAKIGSLLRNLSEQEQKNAYQNNGFSIPNDQLIKLFLIHLKHQSVSPWTPYIHILKLAYSYAASSLF